MEDGEAHTLGLLTEFRRLAREAADSNAEIANQFHELLRSVSSNNTPDVATGLMFKVLSCNARGISARALRPSGRARLRVWLAAMCNLYSMTSSQRAILDMARAMRDHTGNLPTLPGIFPDYQAPIVRNGADDTRELVMARWGMPSSQKALLDAASKRADKLRAKGKDVDFNQLLRMEPDGGVTNIRNTSSKHWKRWLEPQYRCVVPFTSISEFNKDFGGNVWFAFDDTRPLAFFAGICASWTSVRKVKEGETTNDLFGFLTTEPNVEVSKVHPKAMPVILTQQDEIEQWMTAPPAEALRLQRPLTDGALQIVATGQRQDERAEAA